jgi:hypothetical protein
MPQLSPNLFGTLTLIVAPAILTNASSVMALGTSNRFARAVDRVRALSSKTGGFGDDSDAEIALRARQLHAAGKRVLLLVRALTCYYVSVGAFAAAGILSLLGAGLFGSEPEFVQRTALGVVMLAAVVGVGGLVGGSSLLVWETRITLRLLTEETQFRMMHPIHSAPSKPASTD